MQILYILFLFDEYMRDFDVIKFGKGASKEAKIYFLKY